MSKKLSAFDYAFSEPFRFSDGSLVITGDIDRAEAARVIAEYLKDLEGDEFNIEPEYVEDMQGESCWYSGATGRGSKAVWIFR